MRHIHLEGAVNFRDLGGYPTTDGRRVHWGKVYRSDQLAELTDQDVQVLGELDIHSLCDLRAESERLHKPNRRFISRQPEICEFGFTPYGGDELIADARSGEITVEEITARVQEVYRRFVIDQTQSYSKLMALIVNNKLPVLIHCTSGRDRTGFACALILLAAGVAQGTILEDYLLSNNYRRDLTFQLGHGVNAEVMRALTQAKPEYLQASFDAIDEGWGCFDNYLTQALGVSRRQRSQLQTLLLTSVNSRSRP